MYYVLCDYASCMNSGDFNKLSHVPSNYVMGNQKKTKGVPS